MIVKYAGFEKRLIAAFIDVVILSVISLPISFIFLFISTSLITYPITESSNIYSDLSAVNILYFLIIMVIDGLYFSLLESSESQGTFGKQAMDIIVTDINGNRLTFKQAGLRFLGKYLFGFAYFKFNSILILLIWINSHIRPLYTHKKQALHDIIAGTLVVNKPEIR